MTDPAPANPGHDITALFGDRQARLEERVTGLEGGLKTVLGAVNGLGDKLDRKGVWQWGSIFAAGSLILGIVYAIGQSWREPIVARQDAIAAQVAIIGNAVVPRSEVNGIVAAAQRDNDLIRQRLERFENRTDKRLERAESTLYAPAWTATPTAPVRRP